MTCHPAFIVSGITRRKYSGISFTAIRNWGGLGELPTKPSLKLLRLIQNQCSG